MTDTARPWYDGSGVHVLFKGEQDACPACGRPVITAIGNHICYRCYYLFHGECLDLEHIAGCYDCYEEAL